MLIRQVQAHEIQSQYPYFERLMISSKNGVRQVIKAPVAVMTLIALTGGFGIIKAALNDLLRLARWARNTVRPPQPSNGLITLDSIDEILDIDLQPGTPVRDREMGWHQYAPSSHPMTPEST